MLKYTCSNARDYTTNTFNILSCRTTTNLFVAKKPHLIECDLTVEKEVEKTFSHLLCDPSVTSTPSASHQDQHMDDVTVGITDSTFINTTAPKEVISPSMEASTDSTLINTTAPKEVISPSMEASSKYIRSVFCLLNVRHKMLSFCFDLTRNQPLLQPLRRQTLYPHSCHVGSQHFKINKGFYF